MGTFGTWKGACDVGNGALSVMAEGIMHVMSLEHLTNWRVEKL